MRVLHLVTESGVGGAQTVAATLAQGTQQSGAEVGVAAGALGQGQAWLGLDAGIQVFSVRQLVRDVSPVRDISAAMSVSNLYRRWKPDIVHLHTSKAGAVGRVATGVDPGRIVYTMHGYGQLSVANRRFLRVDRALARRSGAVVAVSESDGRKMRADGYQVQVIRNGTRDARGVAVPEGPATLQLEAVRSRSLPIVMVVARDASPKRVDLARAVAARLLGIAEFVWVGGPACPQDPPNFTSVQSSNAAGLLRFADVFLLPSEHEGMPAALLEAMSSALPAVVSAVDGCAEVLGLSDTGVAPSGMAVPNETGAMSSAIAQLCQSRELRLRMGAEARRLWESTYSSEHMLREYLSLYGDLVSQAPPGRSATHSTQGQGVR